MVSLDLILARTHWKSSLIITKMQEQGIPFIIFNSLIFLVFIITIAIGLILSLTPNNQINISIYTRGVYLVDFESKNIYIFLFNITKSFLFNITFCTLGKEEILYHWCFISPISFPYVFLFSWTLYAISYPKFTILLYFSHFFNWVIS